MRISRLVLIGVLLISSRFAFGHGGEDHGEPAASPSVAGDTKRTAWGRSATFEVLVKFQPPPADTDASLLVFVSDATTNAPIAGAKIELELSGPQSAKIPAEPAGSPGVYHATARLATGTYTALATIEAGSELDVVEIKNLDLSTSHVEVARSEGSGVPWVGIGIGTGSFAALIVLVIVLRRRRRRAPVAAAVTLALLASMTVVAHAHEGEEEPSPAAVKSSGLPAGGVYLAKESQFLLGIRTAKAAEREIEARVAAVGRVVARADGHATIAAPQPGRVVAIAGGKLPFLGDKVKRGQPLFMLEQTLSAADAGTVQSQALQARSAIAQARARRDQAQRELERKRALKGVVADKEIQQAELDLELTKRELQLAEEQAALFGGGSLRRITVTSPIDGTIAEANVSLGDQIAADRIVYSIIDASTLWVEANLFEADIPQIEQAGTADIRVDGYDETFRGTVYRIGQIVDPATRTVKVILAVDNPRGRLRVGTFAQVAVGAGAKQRTLAIPDAAVIEEGGRRFVFVHVLPEVFVRREIVLGAREGDFWAVKAGIKVGDRVVTQGTYQLRTSR